jgi:hypothetical protein
LNLPFLSSNPLRRGELRRREHAGRLAPAILLAITTFHYYDVNALLLELSVSVSANNKAVNTAISAFLGLCMCRPLATRKATVR